MKKKSNGGRNVSVEFPFRKGKGDVRKSSEFYFRKLSKKQAPKEFTNSRSFISSKSLINMPNVRKRSFKGMRNRSKEKALKKQKSGKKDKGSIIEEESFGTFKMHEIRINHLSSSQRSSTEDQKKDKKRSSMIQYSGSRKKNSLFSSHLDTSKNLTNRESMSPTHNFMLKNIEKITLKVSSVIEDFKQKSKFLGREEICMVMHLAGLIGKLGPDGLPVDQAEKAELESLFDFIKLKNHKVIYVRDLHNLLLILDGGEHIPDQKSLGNRRPENCIKIHFTSAFRKYIQKRFKGLRRSEKKMEADRLEPIYTTQENFNQKAKQLRSKLKTFLNPKNQVNKPEYITPRQKNNRKSSKDCGFSVKEKSAKSKLSQAREANAANKTLPYMYHRKDSKLKKILYTSVRKDELPKGFSLKIKKMSKNISPRFSPRYDLRMASREKRSKNFNTKKNLNHSKMFKKLDDLNKKYSFNPKEHVAHGKVSKAKKLYKTKMAKIKPEKYSQKRVQKKAVKKFKKKLEEKEPYKETPESQKLVKPFKVVEQENGLKIGEVVNFDFPEEYQEYDEDMDTIVSGRVRSSLQSLVGLSNEMVPEIPQVVPNDKMFTKKLVRKSKGKKKSYSSSATKNEKNLPDLLRDRSFKQLVIGEGEGDKEAGDKEVRVNRILEKVTLSLGKSKLLNIFRP